MNRHTGPNSLASISDVLERIRNKGVRLWSENGRLRYKAPEGALTTDDLERLRGAKDQLIALLEQSQNDERVTERSNPLYPPFSAPLTFTQLAHWRLFHLGQRTSSRQIAIALRLRGRLNVDALKSSLFETIRRHDALRTRIATYSGVPIQSVSDTIEWTLEVESLKQLQESDREAEIQRRIESFISEPIDLALGALFGTKLLQLGGDEHVLIVVIDHLISDAHSMGILIRELMAAYVQIVKGLSCSLPKIAVQFADFAARQGALHKSWIDTHAKSFNARLAGCSRVRFPEARDFEPQFTSGWETVPVRIGKDLKDEMRNWCRLRKTTLVMSVLSVYAALVLRWCGVSECVIQCQTDGRFSRETENTIGYFASVLYLRVTLLEEDSFLDILNRVTSEYCTAHAQADYSYTATQVPPREFTHNPSFNWVPEASPIELSELRGSPDELEVLPISFPNPGLKDLEWDNEPGLLLFDRANEIVGGMRFPLNRNSRLSMQRFCGNLLGFIRSMIRRPERRVHDIMLV